MSAQEIMFNLQLFGEGGGAAGGEGASAGAADGTASATATTGKSGRAAGNPLANVQYGKAPEAEGAQQGSVAQKESAQPTDAVDPDKAFEQLIKGGVQRRVCKAHAAHH